MKPNYPRFLYSNTHEKGMKGPFLVHTISPEIICRICEPQDQVRVSFDPVVNFEKFDIMLLKPKLGKEDADKFTMEIKDSIDDMYQWILAQILERKIEL